MIQLSVQKLSSLTQSAEDMQKRNFIRQFESPDSIVPSTGIATGPSVFWTAETLLATRLSCLNNGSLVSGFCPRLLRTATQVAGHALQSKILMLE
jgi:hypothetical protein